MRTYEPRSTLKYSLRLSVLMRPLSVNLNPIPNLLVDLADLGQPHAHVRGEPVEVALDVGEGLQP